MLTNRLYQSLKLRLKYFLFAFSMFGYGVIALFVSDANASQAITIPYRVAVLLLSIIVIVFLSKKTEIKSNYTNLSLTKKSLILQSMTIVFILIYSIRLFHELINNEELISPPFQYLLNWFGICLIPGMTFFFLEFTSPKKYLYYSWIILSINAFFALPLSQQLSQSFAVSGRLSGEALNPISLGNYATSLILISLYIVMSRKINKTKFNFIFIVPLLPGIYLLFLAASRGPIIGAIVCCLLLILSLKCEGVNIIKLIAGLIIAIFAVNTLSSFATSSGSSYLDRFSSFFAGDDFGNTSYVQRPELLEISSRLIADNPILGFGLELPNLGYPHNIIVEAFLATGLFGGFLFLIISIFTTVKALNMIMDKNSSWSWLGILFIQQLIAAMLSGSLYGSSQFWYLLFAILSVPRKNECAV
jgi:O-antigen ligase